MSVKISQKYAYLLKLGELIFKSNIVGKENETKQKRDDTGHTTKQRKKSTVLLQAQWINVMWQKGVNHDTNFLM